MKSIIANVGIPARPAQRVAFWCLLAALFVPSVGAGSDIQTGRGWRYRVFADNLPKVDSLVARRDGAVYATQCLGDGGGRVVRLRGGQVESMANHLESPRGFLMKKQTVYVAEKGNGGRMLEINLTDNTRREIENIANPEHVRKLPDGDIVVTENGLNGRLVRMTSKRTVDVVTAGLNDPEGLAVGADGTIYIGENGTGRVLAFKDGTLDVVIDDLDELGQIDIAPDGTLWITERGVSGRLLRLKGGALETILSGLDDPRGVALTDGGAVLVSEHGRARILLVEPKGEPKPIRDAKP